MRVNFWIAAFIAGLALAFSCGANAADLRNSVKSVAITTTESTPNPFAGIYGGVTLGGQFTDFNISDGDGQDMLGGIAGNGLTYGGHAGYNFTSGRFVFGPYVEFALSTVAVSLAGEDVLKMDDYLQAGALIGAQTGTNSMISIHAGYEWQNWTLDTRKLGLDIKEDATATAFVVGAAFDTLVSPNVSLGLVVDYLIYDGAEIRDTKLDDYLEGSDALRAKLRLSYRPSVSLPSLEKFLF